VGVLVLVVLIGLTAWVVSWVSIWWVPCYLVLMGLIFIKPNDWRIPRRVAGPANDITAAADTGVNVGGRSAKRDHGEGPIDHRSAEDPDALTLLDGATETLGSEMDSDGTALDVVKPRRGRGRGRKLAKTADATASGVAPATWVRVGPGKFVRADASDLSSSVDHAESQDFAPYDGRLADDTGVMASPIEIAEEMVSTTEPEFFAEPSTVALVATTEDSSLPELDAAEFSIPEVVIPAGALSASTPVAEEYGIAPSAFGMDVDGASCDDNGDPLESGELAEVAGESDLADDFDPDLYASDEAEESADLSDGFAADSGQETYQGRLSVWPAGVSRWTVNAVAAVSGASSRRNIRAGGKLVNRRGLRPPNNRGLQYAARGGLGHGQHVRHTWRPRSPPWGG
jgi:hypothetical protein